MSCDLKVTNESVCSWEKIGAYRWEGGGGGLISGSFILVVEMQFQNCYSLDI